MLLSLSRQPKCRVASKGSRSLPVASWATKSLSTGGLSTSSLFVAWNRGIRMPLKGP